MEVELRKNFGLAVWLKTKENAKASIRAQRAADLYLAAKGSGRGLRLGYGLDGLLCFF